MNIQNVGKELEIVKKEKPLVHFITNSVTMNDCANITIAIGASPIMAMAFEEVEEVVALSKSLVLNTGTMDKNKVEVMIKAGKKANSLNIPVILDPVGVGISKFRKNVVKEIFENVHISIIKGNQSEIKTLCGIEANFKGVDSMEKGDSEESKILSQELSKKTNSVVAITGKIDTISFKDETIFIYNGHEMLKSITGTGCMGTALVGVFSSITNSILDAAISGISCLNIAGEIAYEKTRETNGGSGSFKTYLFDAVYNLKKEELLNRISYK